ncbi:unnamed protein product [Closterium sp. Naga37s-1]|nr:unnamed protein product [Closterium sp. Naga37s-1]
MALKNDCSKIEDIESGAATFSAPDATLPASSSPPRNSLPLFCCAPLAKNAFPASGSANEENPGEFTAIYPSDLHIANPEESREPADDAAAAWARGNAGGGWHCSAREILGHLVAARYGACGMHDAAGPPSLASLPPAAPILRKLILSACPSIDGAGDFRPYLKPGWRPLRSTPLCGATDYASPLSPSPHSPLPHSPPFPPAYLQVPPSFPTGSAWMVPFEINAPVPPSFPTGSAWMVPFEVLPSFPTGSAWMVPFEVNAPVWGDCAFAVHQWTGSIWEGSSWGGSTWGGSMWRGSTWGGSTWGDTTWGDSMWGGNSSRDESEPVFVFAFHSAFLRIGLTRITLHENGFVHPPLPISIPSTLLPFFYHPICSTVRMGEAITRRFPLLVPNQLSSSSTASLFLPSVHPLFYHPSSSTLDCAYGGDIQVPADFFIDVLIDMPQPRGGVTLADANPDGAPAGTMLTWQQLLAAYRDDFVEASRKQRMAQEREETRLGRAEAEGSEREGEEGVNGRGSSTFTSDQQEHFKREISQSALATEAVDGRGRVPPLQEQQRDRRDAVGDGVGDERRSLARSLVTEVQAHPLLRHTGQASHPGMLCVLSMPPGVASTPPGTAFMSPEVMSSRHSMGGGALKGVDRHGMGPGGSRGGERHSVAGGGLKGGDRHSKERMGQEGSMGGKGTMGFAGGMRWEGSMGGAEGMGEERQSVGNWGVDVSAIGGEGSVGSTDASGKLAAPVMGGKQGEGEGGRVEGEGDLFPPARPLHWSKVTNVKGTVKATKSGGKSKTGGGVQGEGGGQGGRKGLGKDELQVVGLARANNVAIMLTQFRMPENQIRDLILAGDPKHVLPPDRLGLLLQVIPTEEAARFRAVSGAASGAMCAPERFLWSISLIPRMRRKIEALMFVRHFHTIVNDARAVIKVFCPAARAIRSSKIFRAVLAAALEVGNELNRGRARASPFPSHPSHPSHPSPLIAGATTLLDVVVIITRGSDSTSAEGGEEGAGEVGSSLVGSAVRNKGGEGGAGRRGKLTVELAAVGEAVRMFQAEVADATSALDTGLRLVDEEVRLLQQEREEARLEEGEADQEEEEEEEERKEREEGQGKGHDSKGEVERQRKGKRVGEGGLMTVLAEFRLSARKEREELATDAEECRSTLRQLACYLGESKPQPSTSDSREPADDAAAAWARGNAGGGWHCSAREILGYLVAARYAPDRPCDNRRWGISSRPDGGEEGAEKDKSSRLGNSAGKEGSCGCNQKRKREGNWRFGQGGEEGARGGGKPSIGQGREEGEEERLQEREEDEEKYQEGEREEGQVGGTGGGTGEGHDSKGEVERQWKEKGKEELANDAEECW